MFRFIFGSLGFQFGASCNGKEVKPPSKFPTRGFSAKEIHSRMRIPRGQKVSPAGRPGEQDSLFKLFSTRKGASSPTVSRNRSSHSRLILWSYFLTRRVNHDLPFFACAFALAADAGLFFQNQVQDAPLARRHGVEAERGVRFANAAGGNVRGKL